MCNRCKQVVGIGDWPFCPHGKPGPFYTGDAQLSPADKVVIDYNPRTGITHIPGRNDRPLHPKKAADGFVRQTLDTVNDIKRFEKRTGRISEALNYNKNSVKAERDTNSI